MFLLTLNFYLMDIKPLKMKAVSPNKTSETTYQASQSHIAKERNHRLHHCENVKNRKVHSIMLY